MRRTRHNFLRKLPAILLVALGVCLGSAGAARAQSIFGDINGDGNVTVLDVGFSQLFALGQLAPTPAQIDTANVFPILSTTGCGPMGNAACIDFANRDAGGEGPGPDAGDITVADVGIIQLVALGQIIMPPRLGISSVVASPSQPRLTGMTATGGQASFHINGSGFQTGLIRVTMTFPEDANETIVCTVDASGMFPLVCLDMNAGCSGQIQITSQADLTTNQIRITAPDVTCHDAAPADGVVSATIKVENLDGALMPVGEADAPDPVVFADSAFELSAFSGNGQAGFPLIALGSPLTVFASDLDGNPVTSSATGFYIEFTVTSNQGASLNGEGEIVSVGLDAGGYASVNVTPFPIPAGGGDLTIEASLVNLYGDPQITGGPAVFTIEMAGPSDLLLRGVSAAGVLCAAGEVCPNDDAMASLIGVELIDQYGARTGGPVTYAFTETGASPNIGAASVLASMTCMSGSPCTIAGGFAQVGLMAGALNMGENLGFHTVTVTASGAPATVYPTGGVAFHVDVERPVGTQLLLQNAGLQAERSVARANVPNPCIDESMAAAPCALDVAVLDQFGRGINGVEVTYAITRSILPADVLTPGGTSSIMVNTATGEMVDGRATATLALSNTGTGGQIDVTASIPAAADLHGGDSALFLFSVGAANAPPPPVNMSRVEVAPPVNNALTTFADGTTAAQLVIRGALGSVLRSGTDDITQYRVQLTIGESAPIETVVTRGLPTGLGVGTDDDRGRFQFQVGSYTPGDIATLRVADAASTPDLSLPRSFILPGVPSGQKLRGFATDRTESKVRVFEADPADVNGTFAEIDTNALLGIQGIVISGEQPTDVVYFDTDPATSGVDRALVLNRGTKDISVLRIADEILSQGNDLMLQGDPGTTVSSNGANFFVGTINGMTGAGRNYNCNPSVGSNFVHNLADDCAVSVGDKLVIDPLGANPVTRTIVEVIDAKTLRLAASLTSQQLPGGGVDFRVVSSYREIDADGLLGTTSTGAESGISRIALPTPDPLVVSGRAEEQPHSMAIWRPTSGTIPGNVEARVFITERAYKGLYILNLVRAADGQWTYAFPDTGVTDNAGFFPLASQRVMSTVTNIATTTSGPADIAIKQGTGPGYKDAVALVVVEVPATQVNFPAGTVAVIALAPDPAPAMMMPTLLEAYMDTTLRFPTQHAGTINPPAGSFTRPQTAVCQGTFAGGFLGCEVDLDQNIDTGTRASSALVASGVYFDCNGDGTGDNVDGVGGSVDIFTSIQRPEAVVAGGVSALTARTTGLPGDWRSQRPENSTASINFTTGGATCSGNSNPTTTWLYRADTALAAIAEDFAPHRVVIPEGLGAGVRTDVALLSVRGDVGNTSGNTNREWQAAYLMDIAVGDDSRLSNNGVGGAINLSVPAAAEASPYPIACVADLPHQTSANHFSGALPHQRQDDNLISYPRASDSAITVFDGPPITTPRSLWGADNTPDTPDDAVFAGDILVVKFASSSFVFHYPITGVDAATSNIFYIRTDRCDDVPGGTVTQFRVIRAGKLIDFSPLGDQQSPGHRDVPQGLTFPAVRTARTNAVFREDLKDIAILDDGADVTGLVSFSTGSYDDAAGATHLGAFDALTCLSDTAARGGLLAGGCAALSAFQSNDPASPVALHLESPDGAGGVMLGATGRFGYLLNSQTGEILVARPERTGGSPALSATIYPSLASLGAPGPGVMESSLSNPPGEVGPFLSRALGAGSPDSRVIVVSPGGTLTVIEEISVGGEFFPRYDDTDNIAGFSAIDFPIVLDESSGTSRALLDDLVVGDSGSGFMGEIYGFVLPGQVLNRELSASLGVINFSQRAAIDFNPNTRQIDGLDTGGRAFVASGFDPGRRQLYGLLLTGISDGYELRAWDLPSMEEVDLTSEVQGVSCQSSGAGSYLSFTKSATDATPTSLAVRDGLVLIGFTGGGVSGAKVAAVDTDHLLAAHFLAGLGCDLDIKDASVIVPLDSSSPRDIQSLVIQGDLAYAAGSTGTSSHLLAALDLVPVWRGRGCGTFSCVPRDVRGVQGGFVPDALAAPPVSLTLQGNLLYVTTERAAGDGLEIFDVAPYNYSGTPPGPGSQSSAISYHAPDKVALMPTSLNVGGCAGRASVGASGLYVADGRLRFDVAGGGPSNCDINLTCPSGSPVASNLYFVNLASPTFNRASPPNLTVLCKTLGDPGSELRDIVFLPPDAAP